MLSVCEEIEQLRDVFKNTLRIRDEKKPEDPKYVCLFDDDR